MKIPGRVTVVETVHHQLPDAEPATVETRFQRWLESDEQLYRRTLRVGAEWTPIDTGWVESPAVLLLRNDREMFAVQPTEEEKTMAAGKVLEIGVRLDGADAVVPLFAVHPGHSFRAEPLAVKSLRVRCRVGSTKCTVAAVPN